MTVAKSSIDALRLLPRNFSNRPTGNSVAARAATSLLPMPIDLAMSSSKIVSTGTSIFICSRNAFDVTTVRMSHCSMHEPSASDDKV